MPSGGARARSGPVQDLNSYRSRRSDDGWIDLPYSVERRRTPNWPMRPAMSAREREVWRSLWRQGQSIMWERQRQHTQVAIYVRLYVRTEDANFDVPLTLISQLRIMGDALGLSLDGLTRHRWRFATDEAHQREADGARPAGAAQPSAAAALGAMFGPPDGS